MQNNFLEGEKFQNDQLKELENFPTSDFQIKFLTEKPQHKTYCKENITRKEISLELTQEPFSNSDFDKIFKELKQCSDYALFVGQLKMGKSLLVKEFARFLTKKIILILYFFAIFDFKIILQKLIFLMFY